MKAVSIYERVGRQDLVRDALEKVGDTCVDLLVWDRAQKTYERLVEMARAQSDNQSEYEHLFRLGALFEAQGEREKAIAYYRCALHLVFGLEDPEELADTLLAIARLLIDDTVHLHRALQLLEAADRIRPDDTEIKRLLGRAKTWQERLMRAGVTLPLVDDSMQEYARRAYEEALP
ncbi:TPA: hypothetical protein EYP38_00515 [Candidatus Micrarchaeota archaeon]|nr:hypothetical protein [Candidatus Micrarchaeota archaeon]